MAKSKSRSVVPPRARRPSRLSNSPPPVVAETPLSSSSTPLSSAYPSAYPTEDETEFNKKFKPFRFLQLPSELRNKIYSFVFLRVPDVVDLDPDNWKKIHRSLAIFCVSKQLHDEAAHHFFSTHTIRLFPTHPGRFFRSKKPLLSRLQAQYRASITSFELRLGPGFTNPPRGWVVNHALGLQDAINIQVLKVMVEVDTSDPIFKGFRRGDDGFYEDFSGNLLSQVLVSTPSIVEIQFDAYPSVRKDGMMMKTLLTVAREHKKLISWGPERGWKDGREEREERDGGWQEESLISATLNLSSLSSVLAELVLVA